MSFAASPLQSLRSLVLPVAALAVAPLAVVSKQTRSVLTQEMERGYVRMLRAAGLSEASVVLRHALRNAALPVLTVMGLLTIGLLSGTVVIETTFALPGLGTLAVSAVSAHDLPVIEGVVVYYTLMVIVINLLIDIVYSWLIPRIRIR